MFTQPKLVVTGQVSLGKRTARNQNATLEQSTLTMQLACLGMPVSIVVDPKTFGEVGVGDVVSVEASVEQGMNNQARFRLTSFKHAQPPAKDRQNLALSTQLTVYSSEGGGWGRR